MRGVGGYRDRSSKGKILCCHPRSRLGGEWWARPTAVLRRVEGPTPRFPMCVPVWVAAL